MNFSFLNRTPVGKLVTRVTNDTEAINQFFTQVVVSLFTDTFILIGVVIVMMRLNILLSLVVLTLIPPLILILNFFRIKVRKAYREIRKWLAQINVRLNETFTGIKVIKLFHQEKKNYEKFDSDAYRYYKSSIQYVVIRGIFMPIVWLLLSCGTALIIWWGGGGVIKATLSLGTLVAFLQYIRMFFEPLEDISQKFDILQSSIAACERVFKLLETQEIEINDGRIEIQKLKGDIEFKNVWFSYDMDKSKSPTWVLKDISFRVNAGEKVAIVGPTGAGKTSLIHLLMQFYEPQKGDILVDGISLRKVDRSSLRKRCAIVAQEDFIFSGSIMDNIRLRNYEVQDKEIERAAKFVNADKFIERLPHKYDQDIKERGTNLSSGEFQLLTFARAIAFNPQILILDEATREVDPEMEQLIQKATLKLLEGRTAIVIAHRLSTIKEVDRILVMHKGKIIEEGTHEELLKNKCLYASLYELQYKND
jgi:ABC-type multidrug transport system fused ATPase/permease subunit